MRSAVVKSPRRNHVLLQSCNLSGLVVSERDATESVKRRNYRKPTHAEYTHIEMALRQDGSYQEDKPKRPVRSRKVAIKASHRHLLLALPPNAKLSGR